jgi:beta-xylosidase
MLSSLLLAATTQVPSQFQNPVWNKNFPDPFIVQDGDTFYAYATQDRISKGGFQIMSSKDLVNWTHLGGIGFLDWSTEHLWAPEIYKWRGKWYLFYSAKDRQSGKRDLAVSVGDKPTGPFKFLSKLVLGTSENAGTDDNGAIDANLYFEGGKPYLLYIREAPPRRVKMVELSPDFTKTVGEAKTLIGIDREIEQGILDAPTLLKHQGKYWLFYSSGWFQSNKQDANYQVWAASSKSLWGEYSKPKDPVLKGKPGETYSPGHQCLVKLRSGEWWMAYHGWNAEGEPRYGKNPIGRTLRIDRLEWTKDGPRCLGPSVAPQSLPKVR